MGTTPERSPVNPASVTVENGPYIIGTFNRKVNRAVSIFLLTIIILVAYFHLHLRVSEWTLVSFWIPFIIVFIATFELWFLPSMFALSVEERKRIRLAAFRSGYIDISIIILGLLLGLICVAFATPSESPQSWIPKLSGSTVSCSSLAAPGLMLLDMQRYDGGNTGPCLATPTIAVSYFIDVLGLLCIVLGLRRYAKIKGRIRMPEPSEELHLNSNVGKFSKKNVIFLLIFGAFLVICLAISLPSALLNSNTATSSNNQALQVTKAFTWVPITATSSPGYTLVVQGGKVYAADPFADPSNPQNILISSSSNDFSLAENAQGGFGFYAKDAANVYAFVHYSRLHIIPVPGADLQTFTVIAPFIGVDKNSSWEAFNKLPFMLDPTSFTILGNNKYRDKNHTYLIGDGITVGYQILDATTSPQ